MRTELKDDTQTAAELYNSEHVCVEDIIQSLVIWGRQYLESSPIQH